MSVPCFVGWATNTNFNLLLFSLRCLYLVVDFYYLFELIWKLQIMEIFLKISTLWNGFSIKNHFRKNTLSRRTLLQPTIELFTDEHRSKLFDCYCRTSSKSASGHLAVVDQSVLLCVSLVIRSQFPSFKLLPWYASEVFHSWNSFTELRSTRWLLLSDRRLNTTKTVSVRNI